MPDRTVVVFGAGATKACGGPLTGEILPEVLDRAKELELTGYLGRVERFLVDNFGLPPRGRRRADHFPPLPLVLSLVDMAIDRGDSFSPKWPLRKLRDVRKGLEYAIFALLDDRLGTPLPHYLDFLQKLCPAPEDVENVTLISLNYDLLADNALPRVAEQRDRFALPNYGCDIATDTYQQVDKFGTLLKLHGSLNWLYCPNCYRLDLGVAERGHGTVKVLNQLYTRHGPLDRQYTEGSPCVDCQTNVVPVLITPTHLKDYRNSHIARIWYEAGRALRAAERVIFVGYSLPDDDVEVIYLLKRGLSDLAKRQPHRITVVEYVPDANASGLDEHTVGLRYRALLGDRIEWRTEGFAAWIEAAAATGFEPMGTVT